MARKTGARAQSVNVQISPNPGENEPENERVSPEQMELDTALDSLPEGTIAKLYRIEPNGEKAFIDQTTPAAMDEQRIASHGAGKYIVVMRGPLNDGTNRVGYKGQRSVIIGESAARAALAAVAPQSAPNAAPNGGGSILDQVAGGMLVSMLQQMQNMNALQMQQSREHSTAMMTMLGKIAERPATDPLIATLLPALLEKRADPIEQATKIAEIAARNSGTKAGTSEVLAALELVEKIREMSGSGEAPKHDGGWMGMVRDALPLIIRGQQQAAATPGAAPVATVEAPPNEINPPQLAGGQPETPNVNDYLAPIAPYFSQIQNAALAGTAPETAADFFTSFIPPGHYDMIYSILDRASVVSDIVKRAPALAPHEKWLTTLVREMRKLVAPEGDGDGDGDDGDDARG